VPDETRVPLLQEVAHRNPKIAHLVRSRLAVQNLGARQRDPSLTCAKPVSHLPGASRPLRSYRTGAVVNGGEEEKTFVKERKSARTCPSSRNLGMIGPAPVLIVYDLASDVCSRSATNLAIHRMPFPHICTHIVNVRSFALQFKQLTFQAESYDVNLVRSSPFSLAPSL
jgi:hypothetical protein